MWRRTTADPIMTNERMTNETRQVSACQASSFGNSLFQSDPDGTRTRVTGVKGRCPRPLDDGAPMNFSAENDPTPLVNGEFWGPAATESAAKINVRALAV